MMRVFAGVSAVAALAFPSVTSAADAGFVAGTRPDRRPEGAPMVKAAPVDKAAALRGVEQPIPPSLKFIDDHGGWYTPFTRPGMRGVYDMRGLHRGAK